VEPVIVWKREIHPVVIVVGAALLGALALWAFDAYRHRGSKTPFEQKADSAKAETQAATVLVARTDTLWLPAQTRYITVRDRNASNPAAHEVGVACDSALAAQGRRVAARDTLVGALRRELDVWQNKPGPPRLEAYAEGLYDAVNAVPVARLGASFRVAGPIDAIAQAEYAAPKAGQSNPSFRAVAGIRYRF
jgi:hypothetical protein